MRREIVNRDYVIIDDFLSQQEHLALWEGFQEAVASPGEQREWNRFYQLRDGEDLVNSTFRGPSLRDATHSTSPGPAGLRALSEKLAALMTGDERPLSVAPWTDFTASPWVYRAGSGLEWHADTGRVAAFIYYTHPTWRPSWGGELMVAADDSSATIAASSLGSSKGHVEEVLRTGGVFIYPRPNRLVLLRGGVLHCVKNVERAAGEAFRASVSGFFFKVEAGAGGRT